MEWKVKQGDVSRPGVTVREDAANICLVCRPESSCELVLYDADGIQTALEIPRSYAVGNLRAVRLDGINFDRYDYNFKIDGVLQQDPCTRRITGRRKWADEDRAGEQGIRGELHCHCSSRDSQEFSWNKDKAPQIAGKDMVLYKLHVRGFTNSLGEKEVYRGTFAGVADRIPYLKSLGITSVELMPVYEFEELLAEKESRVTEYPRWKEKKGDKIRCTAQKPAYKINAWGYGKGFYFAPKASYAAGEDPETELKELVLKLHRKGMECILEIDFADCVQELFMAEVLHYWVREYHIDGFHLQGDHIPFDFLTRDPYLGRTKLFYRDIHPDIVPAEEAQYKRIYKDSDEFLYPARKLLAGQGGNIWELADQMRKQDRKTGYINYLADNNGFTLADLFSYERRHNEANGENNQDGSEWNFSCNCGVEGDTSSRNVRKIRLQRIKNAVAVLFLAQAVPMLMAGDEDGNSQQGNNNAYCQDNPVGWKDWNRTQQNREIFSFVRKMIKFRKEYAMIRQEEPVQLSDTGGYGWPQLSYHEEHAWITEDYSNRRAVGILYCGRYDGVKENVYLGFNFSDYPKRLALPRQPGRHNWYLHMDTGRKNSFPAEEEPVKDGWYLQEAQSVCILIGR